MTFKPPLSLEELKAIQNRNLKNPDVLRLLWEIRRLHTIVMRADQLARSMGDHAGAVGLILDALRSEIKDDPMVIEREKRTPAPAAKPPLMWG